MDALEASRDDRLPPPVRRQSAASGPSRMASIRRPYSRRRMITSQHASRAVTSVRRRRGSAALPPVAVDTARRAEKRDGAALRLLSRGIRRPAPARLRMRVGERRAPLDLDAGRSGRKHAIEVERRASRRFATHGQRPARQRTGLDPASQKGGMWSVVTESPGTASAPWRRRSAAGRTAPAYGSAAEEERAGRCRLDAGQSWVSPPAAIADHIALPAAKSMTPSALRVGGGGKQFADLGGAGQDFEREHRPAGGSVASGSRASR